MQHQIDLSTVQARLRPWNTRADGLSAHVADSALRAYRLGHTCFSDWLLKELAQQAVSQMITAATLSMSKIVAGYVDQTSEEIVAVLCARTGKLAADRSTARAARIRDLLSRADQREHDRGHLGYRLHQYHVGVVCWAGDAAATVDTSPARAPISHVAGKAACADPVSCPATYPARGLAAAGIRDTFDAAEASTSAVDGDIHFAFGDAARAPRGSLTHQQSIAAQAVALATGSPPPRAVTFSEVAPVAMMLGSSDLLRAWVLSTLAGLAADDDHHARLRETLLVSCRRGQLQDTAEKLMLHKNTVQYRIRKAEESLGQRWGENRHDVELALRAATGLARQCFSPVLRRPLPTNHDPRRGCTDRNGAPGLGPGRQAIVT